MTKRDLYDAYDQIKPNQAAKDRMLAQIRAAAEKESSPMKHSVRRYILCVAAVIAACTVLAAAAYAVGAFGLWNLSMGKQELQVPDGNGTVETVPAEMISLQGTFDSPEFLACQEWESFLANYDTDQAILNSIGNNPTGLPSCYDAYLCYTQEMADKIDEICEKYHLSLLTDFATAENAYDLYQACGVGNVLGSQPGYASDSAYGGYYYSDGTFSSDGTCLIFQEGSDAVTVDYQFSRAVKGSFNSTVLNIGDLSNYEQWQITGQNGVPILLANSDNKGLVIVDRPNSFILINVLGDIMNGSYVTNEQLEAFAQVFDFSQID